MKLTIIAAILLAAPVALASITGIDCSDAGAFAEGDTVTITGTGFGASGPSLLFYESMSGLSAGDTTNTDNPYGDGTVASGGMVVSDDHSAMPYGLTANVGSGCGGQYEVIAPSNFTEMYYWMYAYLPAASEANFDAAEPLGSQIKWVWWMYSDDGDSQTGEPDCYSTVPQWQNSSYYWYHPKILLSNDSPFPVDDSLSGWVSTSNWINEPINRQFWLKYGGTPGSQSGSDGYYRDAAATSGPLNTLDLDGSIAVVGGSCTVEEFDRFTFPGYARNFACSESENMVASQFYFSYGDNAPARVEVCDASVYGESKKQSIFRVVSWSDTEIKAIVNQGVFYSGDITTNYIHVHDGDNNHVGSIGLGGAPPISSPSVSSLSRSGNNLTVGWSNADPVGSYHQVLVYENDTLRRAACQVDSLTTSITIPIDSTATNRIRVQAIGADGSVQSTTADTTLAGS